MRMRVRANNQKRDAQGNVINTRRGLPHRPRRAHRPGLLPADGEVRLRWTAPSADPNEVSRYTVEHAVATQLINFRTVNTADGGGATRSLPPGV